MSPSMLKEANRNIALKSQGRGGEGWLKMEEVEVVTPSQLTRGHTSWAVAGFCSKWSSK